MNENKWGRTRLHKLYKMRRIHCNYVAISLENDIATGYCYEPATKLRRSIVNVAQVIIFKPHFKQLLSTNVFRTVCLPSL